MSIETERILLETFGEKRDKLRKKGKRLSFDCYNLKGGRILLHCLRGKSLQKDGRVITLEEVLNGETADACKHCGLFSS